MVEGKLLGKVCTMTGTQQIRLEGPACHVLDIVHTVTWLPAIHILANSSADAWLFAVLHDQYTIVRVFVLRAQLQI